MQTCGMYDYAGAWTYDVGLPAKSGVSGGVIAVLPGQLGIGVFSPPLDARGNSVRGIEVCRRIVRDFDLHPLRTHEATETAVIGRRYTVGPSARPASSRSRSATRIEAQGTRLEVFELQGRLFFADAEQLMRAVLDVPTTVDMVILEGHRLAGVDPPAVTLLHGLAAVAHARRGQMLVVASFPPSDDAGKALVFDAERIPDVDDALEWWEDRVLAEVLGPRDDRVLPLANQELLPWRDRRGGGGTRGGVTIQSYAPGEFLVTGGRPCRLGLLPAVRSDQRAAPHRRSAAPGPPARLVRRGCRGRRAGTARRVDRARPTSWSSAVDGRGVPGGRPRRPRASIPASSRRSTPISRTPCRTDSAAPTAGSAPWSSTAPRPSSPRPQFDLGLARGRGGGR